MNGDDDRWLLDETTKHDQSF